MISAALGLGTTTVAEIVADAPAPPKVLGRDGRKHPSTHAESHRNGGRPAA
jgi:hypothetical protein